MGKYIAIIHIIKTCLDIATVCLSDVISFIQIKLCQEMHSFKMWTCLLDIYKPLATIRK